METKLEFLESENAKLKEAIVWLAQVVKDGKGTRPIPEVLRDIFEEKREEVNTK